MPIPKTLLALVALTLAALPAAAFERHEIRSKDTVLGAITEWDRTHEYLLDVPRDCIVSMGLPKVKGGVLQTSAGFFDANYRAQRMLLIGKRKVQLEQPTTASQTLRVIVTGANDSLGLYTIKPKLKVLKSYTIEGRRSDLSPPGQLTFGALPESEVSVSISWSGPDPVGIESFTGPDGEDVVTDQPGRQRGSTFRQKGFRTTEFGDHRVVLDIPPSARSWRLSIKQKSKEAGRTLDFRPEQGVAPALTLSAVAGPNPLLLVDGESGAGNEVLLTGGNTAPLLLGVLGGSPESCAIGPLEAGSTPRFYGVECDESHSALLTVGSRDANRRILDYVADPIVAPGGGGRTAFSDFLYDSGGRLLGWTEVRRFDVSGAVHTLVVSDILRIPGGGITYTVHHTPPVGPTRRYDYLPFN